MSAKLTMILLLMLTVFSTLAFIGWQINNINERQNIRNNESKTSLVLNDISYINGSLIEGHDWFYWLFPSNTIQINKEITFIQLAVNLHISSFYYETDGDWHSKFGFTVHGVSSYSFDDINFIFKIDGSSWVWGEN